MTDAEQIPCKWKTFNLYIAMESPLVDKSAAFADRILDMSDYLLEPKEVWKEVNFKGKVSKKKELVRPRYSVEEVVKQISRSGTSIGANIAEGVYAQSKDDLISKYSIAIKEASETKYWLDRLLKRMVIDKKMYDSMTSDLAEIIRMLSAAIRTLKAARGGSASGAEKGETSFAEKKRK